MKYRITHTDPPAGCIFAYFAMVIGLLVGWVMNVVKLIGMLDGGITAMFIARCVGVIIAPFGSILGFF